MPTNPIATQLETPNFEKLLPLYELNPLSLELETRSEYESLREVVDYEAIEARAWQLILEHSRPEKRLAFNEPEDNACTALFEALTQKGHISRIEFDGDLEEVHARIIERLLNGYDPALPDPELRRRFAELCEELVDHQVFMAIARGDTPLQTRTYAASDYATSLGAEAKKHGYREENKKGMLREKYLIVRNGQFVRVLEQISRSQADAAETITALGQIGIAVQRRQEADIDLLSTHFSKVVHEAGEGLIGLMRYLDRFKGPDIMYGEPITSETISYDSVAEISQERQEKVRYFVSRLADVERQLDLLEQSGQITYSEWLRQYRQEVRECVREICVINPEYVEEVLGGGVVKEAYLKAHEQYLSGDTGGAANTISAVSSQENSLYICGGEISTGQQTNDPNTTNEMANRLKDIETDKSKWEWKKGYCRMELCVFQRIRTKVGPCAVCPTCQDYFDDGKDPTTEYRKLLLAEAREAQMREVADASEQAAAVSEHLRADDATPIVFEQNGRFYENVATIGIGGMVTKVKEIRREDFVLAS